MTQRGAAKRTVPLSLTASVWGGMEKVNLIDMALEVQIRSIWQGRSRYPNIDTNDERKR